MKLFLFGFLILGSLLCYSQSIVGQWKTIDDNTEKPRSIVDIYQKDGSFFGRVLKTYPKPGEDLDPICDECEDHRKNEKIIGMEIITGLQYDKKSNLYHKGEILDPENGNIYDCKLWVEDDGSLKVRGYLLFFYRTQTWFPYSGE
jgi:uncharacterized protein (DUF2147 family)